MLAHHDRRRKRGPLASWLSIGALGLVASCCTAEPADPSPAAAVSVVAPAGTEAEWRDLKLRIRKRFPAAEQLSIDDYNAWLGADRAQPVLIDVRAAEEFAVSRIPGARHVPLDGDLEELMRGVSRDQPVVAYCSVGWRSSDAAEQLQALGFERVYNLEGSIFEWANRGLPTRGEAGEEPKVHPFDANWGRLLQEARRAPID